MRSRESRDGEYSLLVVVLVHLVRVCTEVHTGTHTKTEKVCKGFWPFCGCFRLGRADTVLSLAAVP
jgi:hypothetical protein